MANPKLPTRTPANGTPKPCQRTPKSAKPTPPSTGGRQSTLLNYFTKSPAAPSPLNAITNTAGSNAANQEEERNVEEQVQGKSNNSKENHFTSDLSKLFSTPKPSSKVVEHSSSFSSGGIRSSTMNLESKEMEPIPGSPTRKTRNKPNNYTISDEEYDKNDPLGSADPPPPRLRTRARAKIIVDDDEGDANYVELTKQDKQDAAARDEDDEMADFIIPDHDADLELSSKKRKRDSKPAPAPAPRKKVTNPKQDTDPDVPMADDSDRDREGGADPGPAGPATSAKSVARKWNYDPAMVVAGSSRDPRQPQTDPKLAVVATSYSSSTVPAKTKEKVCHKEPEDRYPWLADLRDIDMNPVGHKDYDPTTVHIPAECFDEKNKKGFSAFERQYWKIKQRLFDTVVFFKKGKFYELYENDATIGHQLFDLKLTDRVNMRMVGVPESSLDMWINQFVAKGFKVARVEQMESSLGKEMRERGGGTKGDKIIRRELACILTGGTLVDSNMLQGDMATYCAAVKESTYEDSDLSAFGVAFVDTATGQFFVGEFADDADLTKFETFAAQVSPRELLLEKGGISAQAVRVLKRNTGQTTIWNYRRPEREFWNADTTRHNMAAENWFSDEADAGADPGPDSRSGSRTAPSRPGTPAECPPALVQVRNQDLAMSALGALVQYLKELRLDRSLLSQRNFIRYCPIRKDGGTMVLDGQTLTNLEVFANSVNGGSEGTLFGLVNRCSTPFGKRLMRIWVCHPLCHPGRIAERLDAVDMFNSDMSAREVLAATIGRMPDLERLLSRIHSGSCRPQEFLQAVTGFESARKAADLLAEIASGERSQGNCISRGNSNRSSSAILDRLAAKMPDLGPPLQFWADSFDRARAREERRLVPQRGIDPDFDASSDRTDAVRAQLDSLLDDYRVQLKCKTLKFADVGKEIYQLEAPKALRVPAAWRQISSTAVVRRYYFPQLDVLVRKLQEAEEMHSQMSREAALRFYRRFDRDRDVWLRAVRVLAQVDCMVGLARVSSTLGSPSCRPEFVNGPEGDRSVIEFEQLRHPCMIGTVTDFIPNDVQLGGDEPKLMLLTGANAAGKSTVLRMTCTAAIMAQIGCHVPAAKARLTPVDRIMSRLGAHDNIFAGQSTFLVELAETKKILCEATPRTLVILDELGRGTSTYDGLAVAQAVLHHLATHVGCLGFFSTHYHSLAAEFETHPEIRARRMRISVDQAARRICFTFELEDGVAEGSFGMHCASMCGIPDRVVAEAEIIAAEFEDVSRLGGSVVQARQEGHIPLGILSDMAAILRGEEVSEAALGVLVRAIDRL